MGVEKFEHCLAAASPLADKACGEPTDYLLELSCGEHSLYVSVCSRHRSLAESLEPNALSGPCQLCEDLTGTSQPLHLRAADSYTADHPLLEGLRRDRADLDSRA